MFNVRARSWPRQELRRICPVWQIFCLCLVSKLMARLAVKARLCSACVSSFFETSDLSRLRRRDMFQISWKRKGAQLSREVGRDGPRRQVFSTDVQFGGFVVASGTNMMLGDPPPFHSRSHNVATELRKRAAQNASETFSKVETPRGEPHPTHSTASLPELAETHSWLSCSVVPVRYQFVPAWPRLDVEAWSHRGVAGRTASGGRAAGSGAQWP